MLTKLPKLIELARVKLGFKPSPPDPRAYALVPISH